MPAPGWRDQSEERGRARTREEDESRRDEGVWEHKRVDPSRETNEYYDDAETDWSDAETDWSDGEEVDYEDEYEYPRDYFAKKERPVEHLPPPSQGDPYGQGSYMPKVTSQVHYTGPVSYSKLSDQSQCMMFL
jgi:hypothetical protein